MRGKSRDLFDLRTHPTLLTLTVHTYQLNTSQIELAFQNYQHHEVHDLNHLVFTAGAGRFRTPANRGKWFVDSILLRTRTCAIFADNDIDAVVYDERTS